MYKVQKELRLGKKYKQIKIKHKYTLISMDMKLGLVPFTKVRLMDH